MIINGTTNIILTAMERDGVGLAQALAQAQRRGFAEADPSADVEGHDAAAKLVLLARLGFEAGVTTADVDRRGIDGVDALDIACAGRLGGSVKLVANATRIGAGLALWVRPTIVLLGHPLHGVDDAENALLVGADLAGEVLLRGPGGGGDSTASAVVSDIVASVRDPHQAPPSPARQAPLAPSAAVERCAYLRVRLRDVAEAADTVVQALEDRGVPVAATTTPAPPPGRDQLALLTGAVRGETLERAVETLDSLAVVNEVAAVLDCIGLAA